MNHKKELFVGVGVAHAWSIIIFVNKARSVLLFGCFSVYEDDVEDNKKS